MLEIFKLDKTQLKYQELYGYIKIFYKAKNHEI